jgi:hypothetical protein
MKNGKTVFFRKTGYGIMTLLLAGILLGGCSNFFGPLSPPQNNGGSGLLISIGSGGERTLFPRSDFSRYVISFSGPGSRASIDTTNTSGIQVDGLAPGLWTITVTAYMEIDADGDGDIESDEEFEAASSGPVEVTVSGGYQTISIPISATQGGADGYLNYSISFPDAMVDSAFLSIRNFSGEGTPIPAIDFSSTSGSAEGVVPLAAGYYVLTAELQNDYHRAGRMEIVHIYSGMETVADWTFDTGDFVDYITLSGSASIAVGVPGDSVWVQLYREPITSANLSTLIPLARGEVMSNTWSIPITPYGVSTSVYALVAVSTGESWAYYLPGTSAIPVHNTDVSAINLSVFLSAAAVGDVTINGSQNVAINAKSFTLGLSGTATFKAIAAGTQVNWIDNLPMGLQARVNAAVSDDATALGITVSGTPLTAASGPLSVTIPVGALNGVLSGITAASNPDAQYNITGPGKTITVTGIPVEALGLYYDLGIVSSKDVSITDPPIAYLPPGQINATSITGSLLIYPSELAWTGTGDYYIGIIVYGDSSHSTPVAAFITSTAKSFAGTAVTVDFSEFEMLDTTPQVGATINTTVVASITGQAMSGDVQIILENTSFTGIAGYPTATDVSSWFNNLPTGLSAHVRDFWHSGNNSWTLWINLEGTPTVAVNSVPISITIPAANITGGNGGENLDVTPNPSALFHITASADTLSGSITLILDGLPFEQVVTPPGYTSYGRIQFYGNPDLNGFYLASAEIDEDGDWSISLPSNYPGDVYAGVSMPDSSGMFSSPQYVGQHSGSGNWDIGTKSFVSLSGTLSATINGVTFVPNPSQGEYIYIDASVEGMRIDRYSASDTGDWLFILPAQTSPPRIVRLDVHLQGSAYSRYNAWTGPVQDQPESTGHLSLVFKTISGSMGAIIVDSITMPDAGLYVVNEEKSEMLGWGTIDISGGGYWTANMGDYSGIVKFIVMTYKNGYNILSHALATTATVTTGGNTVSIPAVDIVTRDITVTVMDGLEPVNCVIYIATAALSSADFGDLPAHKLAAFSGPTTPIQTIPVDVNHPNSLYFLVMTLDEHYFVTTSPVDTTSPVTLDINEMLELTEP